MKIKLLFVFTFFLTFNSIGQTTIDPGGNFYFRTSLSPELNANKLKLNKENAIPNGAEIRYNAQVKVLNIENDRVYFRFFRFSEQNDINAFNDDSDGKTRVFSMSKDDFKNLTKRYYNTFRGFKYGAYTVPIRLRSSKGVFEFDSNLSLGANILGRLGLSRFKENLFVDFSFGLGVTKVNLNKENSILGTEGSDFENIDVLSPTAFTVSFGVLLNLAKNVNIGAYLGWDRLSTADNKTNWIYNNKPWTGIGLNISFSGKADDNNSSKE